MKTFYPYTKGYRQWILLGVACSVAEAVLERCGEERRACRTAEEKRAAALWLTAGALAVILLI